MRFVREKAVKSGSKYKDVNIYTLTTEQEEWHRKKSRKKLSTPKQVKQDWKHAQQYATQLVNANFGIGDYLVELTYGEEPPTREQAEKDAANYVARLKRLYLKYGIKLKAFWVTGGGHERKDGKEGLTRFHHHLIISGGVPRDLVEDCWNKKNDNRVSCDRVKIKSDDFGLEPRVKYMVKPAHCSDEPNAKRWRTCGVLRKPVEQRNDNRYSEAEAAKLVKAIRENRTTEIRTFVRSHYRGWELVDEPEAKTNEVTGLPEIRLKLIKNTT